MALVEATPINLRCGPVGVPNHAPIPLLSLYLKANPERIQSAEVGGISSGVYVDPANAKVEEDYVLDKNDPHEEVSVPPGFTEHDIEPLVDHLYALQIVDRAPLVETPPAGRLPPPATPARVLPLRLTVFA